MSRKLAIGVAMCATLLWAMGAMAGDYHRGETLKCQDCHIMHASQGHGYSPDGTGNWNSDFNTDGVHYLLRNEVNELCLSCHEGSGFAPDVFELPTSGYVRQAGALNEVGGNGFYPDATGHSLGATDVPPGWDDAGGADPWSGTPLNCVMCHAAHGGGVGWTGAGSYRNLGGFGTVPGSLFLMSYTNTTDDGANPATAWVHENLNAGNVAGHYGVGAVAFNEPAAGSKYAEFCAGCHGNFHGDVGSTQIGGVAPGEEFIRHPAGYVDIGALTGGHSNLGVFTGHVNQVQVLSPLGQKAGGYDGTDTGLTASCMSCHKAHGNQNAFGLIYMAGTGTITEQGDDGTQYRDLCKQCHVQG